MNPRPLRKALVLLAALVLTASTFSCSDAPTQSAENPFPEIDVTDTENQADYVMIVPRSLAQGLQTLVTHRQDQDLSVTVVTLEQIAAGFPDAPSVEEGIRTFISYAYQNWSEPRIEYVLLAGDTDLIPTFVFESNLEQFGETEVAIDDPYSTVEGDDDEFPDLALGRVPVSSLRELRTVVQKTVDFERTGGGLYETASLIVADFSQSSGLGLSFETAAEDFSETFTEGQAVRRIDVREDSPRHGTQEDFFSEMEKGARVVAYFGFGTESGWSGSDLMTVQDVPKLPAGRNPSFVMCLTSNQKFNDFGTKTLIRELILFESGGSVASLAPSGLVSFVSARNFLATFWGEILQVPDQTVGRAVLAAKRAHEAGMDGDFTGQPSRYTVLGDPALRLGI